MGASQSARKLTISNDDELGVIHISSGVAQRLAHGIGNAKKEGGVTEGNSNVRLGGAQESTSNSVKQKTVHEANDQQLHNNSVQSQTPPVHLHPEYTMSALKMQQQKEEELGNQNLYWQKRMQNLKDNHAKIDRILEEEYQRAVDQVASAQGKKIDINSVIPPCIDNKDKVLNCYQDNPREILKCSSLVEEFSNCVSERRGRLIAARC